MSTAYPMVALGEVSNLVERRETTVPGTTYRQIGVRLWGEGAYEREPVDGSQTKYKALSSVKAGDIIVNKIWARNGSVAVVTDELSGCYGSNEFPTFAALPDVLEPRWVHWITKTKYFWTQCDEQSRGTSGKNRIRPEKFLQIRIPLPPLSEQRRIVARIEELVGKVEEARRLRREAVKEAIALQAAASKAVFERVHCDTKELVTLGDIAEVRAGVTLGRKLNGPTIRLPYLRVANVQDSYLDLDIVKEVDILPSEVEKWSLETGDILLTEGGDWDKLGRGTVWRGEIQGCIHQNHIYRLRVNLSDHDPGFLSALIGSPYGKSYFQAAAKQTTNLATINQRQLKAFQVPSLSLSDQQSIVAELDELQTQVDSLKQLQNGTEKELEAMIPSILDRAFAGKL